MVASTAFAACPLELAVYGDRRQGAAEHRFQADRRSRPSSPTRSRWCSTRMSCSTASSCGRRVWRGRMASLMYKCPTGDVTGDELAACTLWEGVIYSADDQGNIALLPAEGDRRAAEADLSRSRAVAADVGCLSAPRVFQSAVGCFRVEGLSGMSAAQKVLLVTGGSRGIGAATSAGLPPRPATASRSTMPRTRRPPSTGRRGDRGGRRRGDCRQGRCRQRGRRAGDVRGGRPGLRPARRPRQQCRHRRPEGARRRDERWRGWSA